MRATLTMEDELFRETTEAATKARSSLSAFITETLRSVAGAGAGPLPVSSASGSLQHGLSYDRVAELLDYLDDVDADLGCDNPDKRIPA